MRATGSTLQMIWKLGVVVVIVTFSILLSTLIVYNKPPCNSHELKPTKHIPTENDMHDIIRTRNELSLQLNNAKRLIGQMQCEVIVN